MYVNNNGMYSGYKLFDEPAIAMRIFAQKVEKEKKSGMSERKTAILLLPLRNCCCGGADNCWRESTATLVKFCAKLTVCAIVRCISLV